METRFADRRHFGFIYHIFLEREFGLLDATSIGCFLFSFVSSSFSFLIYNGCFLSYAFAQKKKKKKPRQPLLALMMMRSYLRETGVGYTPS